MLLDKKMSEILIIRATGTYAALSTPSFTPAFQYSALENAQNCSLAEELLFH